MSSLQKREETIDHILNTIKNILKIFQKDQKDIEKNTNKVAKEIQKMIESNFKDIPDVDTMILAIQTIPTKHNWEFMEKTNEIIDRLFLRKIDNENPDLTGERLAEWIKLWFKFVNIVKIEYREQVIKSQNKTFVLTGKVDPLDVADSELEEEENKKKSKKKSSKKEETGWNI